MPEDKTIQPEKRIERGIDELLSKSKQEQIKVPEQGGFEKMETSPEKLEEIGGEKQFQKIQEGLASDERMGAAGVMPASVLQRHKEREKEIESILAQDLDDFYLSMGEEKRMQFRFVGERTARTINVMIESGKLQAQKVIELIKKWLGMVPGINKFFVEQQTKIKTDRIMQVKK